MRQLDPLLPPITLKDVQAVYSGPEGQLWELVMGQQIHIGGMVSSMDLAKQAGVAGMKTGIDLCCCTGAGMRLLVRFCNVGQMIGVDATDQVVHLGRQRCAAEGSADRISFVLAEVTRTRLPAASADFVWGEDAWCYVADKPALVREAARLVKPGGVIAFTDWIEGAKPMTDAEAARYLKFMKFPNVLDLAGYKSLLSSAGCKVVQAHDTGRFAPYVKLYLDMLNMQLTSDALRIIGYDMNLMQAMGQEMRFMQELADAGKIAQGLFVARKE